MIGIRKINYAINQRALVKLSDAFKILLNDPVLNNFCIGLLENETTNSINRRKIYLENCKEPWQTILWCFCSLNTKGSSKVSRQKWLENFSHMSGLINPDFLFKEFHGNEEKIFCAINLILRQFAGGRFLTVSKKHYQRQYEAFQNIELPDNDDLINIVSTINISLIASKGKINTTSFKLFELYKKNKFEVKSINNSFPHLDLITIKVKDLINNFKFLGISNKFARNIKMDILANNIIGYYAIDSRIQNVLESIGFGKINIDKDYEQIECFFNMLVNEEKYLGLIELKYKDRSIMFNRFSSWELDRLIFALSDSKNNILSVYLSKFNQI
jgi:hypothetical protein